MKLKKAAALFLALTMILSLAACGNSESSAPDTSAPDTQAADTQAADTQADDSEPADTQADDNSGSESGYNVTWDDTAEIVVLYPSMGPIPSGLQAVEDAMNEITEEQINTHVTLKVIEVGNYDQQVNLMTAGGEQLDLMVTMPGGPASLGTMAAQNQLMDITELLEEYAPKA